MTAQEAAEGAHMGGTVSGEARLRGDRGRCGRPRRVIGIDASATLDKTVDQVTRIANTTAEKIGLGREIRDDEVVIRSGWEGPAYGIPDESTIEAIRTTGEQEGVILDPVYEGKSMAGLYRADPCGRAHGGQHGPLRSPGRPVGAERVQQHLRGVRLAPARREAPVTGTNHRVGARCFVLVTGVSYSW